MESAKLVSRSSQDVIGMEEAESRLNVGLPKAVSNDRRPPAWAPKSVLIKLKWIIDHQREKRTCLFQDSTESACNCICLGW